MKQLEINQKYISLLMQTVEDKDKIEFYIRKLWNNRVTRAVRFHDIQLGRKYGYREYKNDILQADCDGEYFGASIQDIERMRVELSGKDNELEDVLYKRLESYMDIDLIKNVKIYFYVWKFDAGFSLTMKTAFVNLGSIIKGKKNVENIIAHELYHARNRSINVRLKSLLQENNSNNQLRIIYSTLFEEGIATLIEKGPIEKDVLDEKTANIINNVISRVLHEKNLLLRKKIVDKFLQDELKAIYSWGHYAASQVYLTYGKEGLDIWTKHRNWKGFLKLLSSLDKVSLKENEYSNKI